MRKQKSVLVASLVCNEPWLQRFLDCLTKLDYPKEAIKYAFVEDKKIPILHQWAEGDTWIKEANPSISDRLCKLAYLRNLIIQEDLKQDYILWIDSDVVNFPPTLITDLIKNHLAVVAPTVWIEGTKRFYDTFAFRFLNGQNFPALNLPSQGLVEVQSVGTCYIAASHLYNKSKVRYYGGDSEQVNFCKEVRKLGERIYVDFNVRIEHVNFEKYGRKWH